MSSRCGGRDQDVAVDITLDALVKQYISVLKPKLDKEIEWFASAQGIEEAIDRGSRCEYQDGRLHSHQYRVGKEALATFRETMLSRRAEIAACTTFEELRLIVEDEAHRHARIGELAVYDIASRIGAALGLMPDRVYLHAGTRKGASNLGLCGAGGSISIDELPKEMRVLSADDAENFLCIYKDELARLAA
ncbi:MAG: hypothetical protein AAGB51_08205 [Planctomycetota bacterium]